MTTDQDANNMPSFGSLSFVVQTLELKPFFCWTVSWRGFRTANRMTGKLPSWLPGKHLEKVSCFLRNYPDFYCHSYGQSLGIQIKAKHGDTAINLKRSLGILLDE